MSDLEFRFNIKTINQSLHNRFHICVIFETKNIFNLRLKRESRANAAAEDWKRIMQLVDELN